MRTEDLDETWLKELNKKNSDLEGEYISTLDFAIVSLSSSVLNKLSLEEQEKFDITEFHRATNEIEHWARVEEICDFLESKTLICQVMFIQELLKILL